MAAETPSALERFNLTAGWILGTLVDAYPVPTDLEIEGLTAGAGEDDPMMLWHAVHSLTKEGLLLHDGIATSGVIAFRVVLTARALALLEQTPPGFTPRQPLGRSLAASTRSGGTRASRQTITDAVAWLWESL